jgi:hypothetical protein
MHGLEEIRRSQTEWRAWRVVCLELHRLGIDLNREDLLGTAIVVWGEELVALRNRQTPKVQSGAYEEAIAKFEEVWNNDLDAIWEREEGKEETAAGASARAIAGTRR